MTADASTTTTDRVVDHAAASADARAAREPHPVADEQLAAERAEEDQPLHDADEPRREVDALQRVARVLQAAEQERDEADRERVVARERRDHDARVAVAGGGQAARVERVAEVAVLARAADAGDRAGERHHGEDLPPRAHAGVRRGARRVADHLHLEAEPRARVEHPHEAAISDAEQQAERHDSEPTCDSGQLAASGSVLPCGNTLAVGLDVSRQYDSESKIR